MGGKRLLLVGSGGRTFRQYALEAISQRASILLLTDQDLTWQAPYVSEYVKVDPRDPVALADAGRKLNPDGVLTYYEQLAEPTAQLAASLGIPHTDPGAIQRCRDKNALRHCLNQAGLSPVRHGVASTEKEAADLAASIGYPVILKPRSLGGSIGVVRVDDPQQMTDSFRVAAGASADDGSVSRYPGVLIEELLDGPEYSVDCVSWDGVTHPLVIAEKMLGFEPYFEETGHVVPAAMRDGLPEAIAMVVAAHQALGLNRLVSHSEFRLTSHGPRIIEVNPRLGGDLIPLLGYLAIGVDLASAAADVALGNVPDLTAHRSRVAAVRMFYPPSDMRIKRVALRSDPSDYPGLEFFTVMVSEGTDVRLPPRHFLSRVALAVVTAEDRSECESRLRAVEADVIIDGKIIPTG